MCDQLMVNLPQPFGVVTATDLNSHLMYEQRTHKTIDSIIYLVYYDEV